MIISKNKKQNYKEEYYSNLACVFNIDLLTLQKIIMLLSIHPKNPDKRKLQMIKECLHDGGVIIYPTDTIYGIGCDIYQPRAVERICRIKEIKVEKANFSLIFFDLSQLADFTKPFDNSVYRILRKALPGPFTFILQANNEIPKIFRSRKKTIGIRVPDNNICREIVKTLGNPIMNSSIHDDDTILKYPTEPAVIYEKYKKLVDIVIDGGTGNLDASTIVDFSSGELKIIRQGMGIIEGYS
ncbi:MAG: L-threonylcarbamoyladenylate synthase [Bacteroidota bacterium]